MEGFLHALHVKLRRSYTRAGDAEESISSLRAMNLHTILKLPGKGLFEYVPIASQLQRQLVG